MRSDIASSTDLLYAVAETGERIGFDMCFAADCGLHISRCECEDGPTPPNLGASAGALKVMPATEAVTSAA